MLPRRGEVWLFDLGMTPKTRPVLVVSVDYGDADRAMVTVVPHTTGLRQSPFEVPVKAPFLRPGAFLVQVFPRTRKHGQFENSATCNRLKFSRLRIAWRSGSVSRPKKTPDQPQSVESPILDPNAARHEIRLSLSRKRVRRNDPSQKLTPPYHYRTP